MRLVVQAMAVTAAAAVAAAALAVVIGLVVRYTVRADRGPASTPPGRPDRSSWAR